MEKKLKPNNEFKKLKQDFNQTFNSPHGKSVLRYLLNQCGYQSVSTTMNPQSGEINTVATIYNEARRNVYLKIRSFLMEEILRDVENQLKGE